MGKPQQEKETLRFLTCGSVDDGKSTLIGRLLHEAQAIPEDQRAALERDSRQYGTRSGGIDYALLLDGLQAEREQAITIDVAYRHFESARRRFIIADAPGHEQYTRNMATAASTASLAVVLVDARKGVVQQTRRHTRILAMMGVPQVIVAVNKMDLVDFDEDAFQRIAGDFLAFAAPLRFASLDAIPVCATDGDNVFARSSRMPWYDGASLMQALETADIAPSTVPRALRLPVQAVIRPNADFRGFAGTVAHGRVAKGDRIRVAPSGRESRVKEILRGFASVESAGADDAVTLTLADEVDASRGDVIAAAEDAPQAADQFEARLLWLDQHALMPGRPYLLKIHAKEVSASVTEIKFREDVEGGAHLAAKTLALNDIGVVNLATAQPVVFEPYADSRRLGSFILIDKLTLATAGAGMILFALRRASNIQWQALDVDRRARSALMHQKARCIWFTGLPASGKSTIANLVEKRLHAAGRHTYLLDGDNVRHGLNRDLGFTEADRVENIRRVAEVARLMVDAGLIVLVSFISPFRAERRLARDLFQPDEFVEVFVDTPLEECERRDPKGLYAKARRGALKNFTGIDSAYEPPEAPEIHLATIELSAEESVRRILERLG